MNPFTRMWVLTHMLDFLCCLLPFFCLVLCFFNVFFVFLLFIYVLFSFLILKSSLAFLITSHHSVTSVISHVPLFFHPKSDFFSKSFFFLPFIPPLFFPALIRLSQCVPRALAYTNQKGLLVLEHRRKEFHKHTVCNTHTHMDYILFLSTTEHGFDSPTTASTGCVKHSSKENVKSEFV